MTQKRFLTKKRIKDILMVNFGVIALAFSFSMFLSPNQLVIGGVGGLSILLSDILKTQQNLQITPSVLILGFNILLLIVAWFFVGKSFFLKTLYCSIAYPVYSYLWELLYKSGFHKYIPKLETTGDYLLILIFAAVISGWGIGTVVKRGASTGGVDILQQVCLKYLKLPLSISLLLIDGITVCIAGIYYQNLYAVLYGILFIVLSGNIVDSIVFSGFNVRAVTIITRLPDEVKAYILKKLDRGVTEIQAKGGFRNHDVKMLICVMSSSEYFRLRSAMQRIDPKAFIYVTRASEVDGMGFSYEKVRETEPPISQ